MSLVGSHEWQKVAVFLPGDLARRLARYNLTHRGDPVDIHKVTQDALRMTLNFLEGLNDDAGEAD